MFTRFFGQKIAAIGLALGIFLTGVGPSWSAPVINNTESMPGMTMADMAMPTPCAGMEKSMPGKKMPCNDGGMCCAVCTGCAINVAGSQGFSPINLLYNGELRATSRGMNRAELTTAPPLPPPILHA
jgi:hypothetical protein